MDFDVWHHWLFLRPLIVFVLACPLLILAVFVGPRRSQPTRLEDKCHSNGPGMTKDRHTGRSVSIESAPSLYAAFTRRRRAFYEVLMCGHLFSRVSQRQLPKEH